jgi:hypothetical protein
MDCHERFVSVAQQIASISDPIERKKAVSVVMGLPLHDSLSRGTESTGDVSKV